MNDESFNDLTTEQKIEHLKSLTAASLGMDPNDLGYINEEYLSDMEKAEAENFEEADVELIHIGDMSVTRRGYYCNNVTRHNNGKITYYRGKKGTPNYGCSKDMFREWKMKPGYEVRRLGKCRGKSYYEFFVGKW